ncbi:hypothetical protein [Planctomycetes bacterium Poly30]|uniref:hypothetical protein n=1 Tax=Saltatorellus ferox TaxID=2528018 RepID=UPI0011AAE18D
MGTALDVLHARRRRKTDAKHRLDVPIPVVKEERHRPQRCSRSKAGFVDTGPYPDDLVHELSEILRVDRAVIDRDVDSAARVEFDDGSDTTVLGDADPGRFVAPAPKGASEFTEAALKDQRNVTDSADVKFDVAPW